MPAERSQLTEIVTQSYVYILRCGDETLYTGYTTDMTRRLREHRAGTGAKYTKGRTPLDVRRVELYDNRGDAMSREYEIKQLSKEAKEALVPTGERVRFVQTETHRDQR